MNAKIKARVLSALFFSTTLFFTQCGSGTDGVVLDANSSSQVAGGSESLTTLNSTASSSLNSTILNSPSVSAALIRAQSLARTAAQVQYETIDISTEDYDCPDGGTASFAGSIDSAVSGNTLSVTGDFTQTFVSCEVSTTVETSDGNCDITAEFTGSFDESYDLDYNTLDDSFDVTSTWLTSDPLDLLLNGSAHEVEFNILFTTDDTGATDLSGDITIDGTSYDVDTEVDTTQYSSSELGCD